MAMNVDIEPMILSCDAVSMSAEAVEGDGRRTQMCAKCTLFEVLQYVFAAMLIAVAIHRMMLTGTHCRTPKASF